MSFARVPSITLWCLFLALGCDDRPGQTPRPTDAGGGPALSASSTTAPPAAEHFSPLAFGPPRSHLYTLGRHTFLVSGRVLYRLDKDGVHQNVHLLDGFPGRIHGVSHAGGEGYALMGHWPDAAWLSAWSQSGTSKRAQVITINYRWVRDRWQRVDVTRGDETLRGVSLWKNGSALALLGDDRGVRLTPANSNGLVDVAPSAAASPDAGARRCSTRLAGHARAPFTDASAPRGGEILAFESGPVFIAGASCGDSEHWLVERLVPGGAPVIDELPRDAKLRDPHFLLAGSSPKSVYALVRESGALLHFDGNRWERQSSPEAIVDIAVSAESTLWAVTAGRVLRRRGGNWQAVPAPLEPGEKLAEVSAARDGLAWALAVSREGARLLSNAIHPAALLKLPNEKESENADRDITRFPYSHACEQPYVLLLSRVNPREKSFAGVVDRLAGEKDLTLVTESSEHWTHLGAKVRGFDESSAVIRKMAGYPKSKPTLFCHDPKVDRVVPQNP